MAVEKYIVFSLNDRKYSMKLTRVYGIETTYQIVPIPMGAACIKGIIHLRNNVIPVFSLKKLFDEEEDSGKPQQLLITETHDIMLGIEVDDVLGIVPVEDQDVRKIPLVVHTEQTGYLEDVVKINLPGTEKDEIVISISVDGLMSEQDFGQVTEALEKERNEK